MVTIFKLLTILEKVAPGEEREVKKKNEGKKKRS